MDKPEVQLLADLILDVKKDVSELKRDMSDTKDMAQANSISLNEHMRRSEASENRLDLQEDKLDHFIKEMEPVKEHVKAVSLLTSLIGKCLKVFTVLLSLVGAVLGILKLLR